jgi:hypothetical protein
MCEDRSEGWRGVFRDENTGSEGVALSLQDSMRGYIFANSFTATEGGFKMSAGMELLDEMQLGSSPRPSPFSITNKNANLPQSHV